MLNRLIRFLGKRPRLLGVVAGVIFIACESALIMLFF